jgi:hypothetical protein
MTENQRWLLAALGVFAVLAWLSSAWSPLPGAQHPARGLTDVIWRQGYPVGHQHLAAPADIAGGPLSAPHPLYRRPPRCGHNRSCLVDHGWDWIINPPSEMQVGPGGGWSD